MLIEFCIYTCVVLVPFTVLAFLWYRVRRTRGRLLFFLGWLCASFELPTARIMAKLYLPRITSDSPPADFQRVVLGNSLWEVADSLPLMIIGMGFLLIVFKESNRRKSEAQT
jgi:hypothetical protein